MTGDNRYVAAHLAESIGLDSRRHADRRGDRRASRTKRSGTRRSAPSSSSKSTRSRRNASSARCRPWGTRSGYLGDGINDAPALHAADVGISVDKAVDVARESADVVLLEPDLDVLRRGVEDGRRTFANTLKYISITTSANFGNMVSMALATPLLPFLPLAAKQILLNNFLSDVPLGLHLDRQRGSPSALTRAQRWQVGELQRFMIVFGLLSTVFDLATFAVLLKVFRREPGRSSRPPGSSCRCSPNSRWSWCCAPMDRHCAAGRARVLLWSTVAVTGAAPWPCPYLGAPAAVFSFVPLPMSIAGTGVGDRAPPTYSARNW